MAAWGICLRCMLFFVAAVDVKGTTSRKIYAAGSGLDMLSQAETVREIIALSGKKAPRVLYLGTATYDAAGPGKTQTQSFHDAGCAVSALNVAVESPSVEEMRPLFEKADIVLVSGGNTLYAHDRLVKLGVDRLIREALAKGTVMCGGSAGGIIWFDGGHSDSMEVESYKNAPGPLLNPSMSKQEMEAWAYIRVPGLSILPGLFCPHYDMTESNGALRASDFTGMLQRHSGETGIAIDNWGAIVVDGDSYRVISRQGKPGSHGADGEFVSNRTGVPGAWKLKINNEDGSLQRTPVPVQGKVNDLFTPAKYIVQSNMLPVARAQNPDDGRKPDSGFNEMEVTSYRRLLV
eukprot:TRINITY_DN20735_c0_g1_i1.p1 TRINITY_DN20735_c0_g1~~TRINITY_DN20735_c0_g1_i1.p1  ORF type:complete len:348 (+),score=44.49 TRINITY_DN20735_c0_g1_i1:45-1088(+)